MPSVDQARSWYPDSDPVHGFDHVLRVYRMAERLAAGLEDLHGRRVGQLRLAPEDTPNFARLVPADPTMSTRIETPGGAVSVEYTLPDGHAPGSAPVVVLAHGAGSDMRNPPLVRLAHAVAQAGIVCCRFNFAYRETGRRLPDRLPALVACYRAVAEHVAADRALAPPWVPLGGRSLGGRVASHLVASGHSAAGLVFLAFPLHPAGRPDTARAAHLASLAVPMLFVQGTRDTLATWSLFEPSTACSRASAG